MSREGPNRFWKQSRRAFRWCRITVWFAALFCATALLYLNYGGLPDFIKKRVVAGLEAEGLDLSFARLRLKGYRRIIVEDVQLKTTNAPAPVRFVAKQAELKLDRDSLRRFQFVADALDLTDGSLTFDLQDTNHSALAIDDVQMQIRRDARDLWRIPAFEGRALGARWNISGSLTNLSLLQSQKAPQASSARPDWTPALRKISETLGNLKFDSPPVVVIAALGDLKDLAAFRASISVRGASARTAWGEFDSVFLRTTVSPSKNIGEQMEVAVNLKVKSAKTRWGTFFDTAFLSQTSYPLTNGASFESASTLFAADVRTPWFSGQRIDVNLVTRQSGTNLVTDATAFAEKGNLVLGSAAGATFQARLEHAYPLASLNAVLVGLLPVKPAIVVLPSEGAILSLGQHWSGDWKLNLDGLRTKTGAAGKLNFSGDIRERVDLAATDSNWGLWRPFAPFVINWRAEAIDFRGGDARLERVAARGKWRAPEFTIDAMDSQLYDGSFHLDAQLDVPTRALAAKARMDFDVKKIAGLLDPEVRIFLDSFTWENPPEISAHVSLIAPPWVNPGGNARGEMLKTAALEGALSVGAASYRGVNCSSFYSSFSLTNDVWRVPDAVLRRPEGAIELAFQGHASDPTFELKIRGGVDPWAALPMLEEKAQEGLKFVKFHEPPQLEGTLSGHLRKPEMLRFNGSILSSNFVVRGEPFLDVKTKVVYSNMWFYLTDPVAHRTTNEVLTAGFAAVDLRALVMHVTNGFSTTDPYKFTKIIGPQTFRAIEPYKFAKPPSVIAEGTVPLRDAHDANIRFQITGDEFSYWRFNMTGAQGGVFWHNEFLEVTNFTANFYGGELEWEGHFTFLQDDSAQYRFRGVTTNVNIKPLLADLLPAATNRLEGIVHGTLVVTDAHSDSLNSWRGHGEATLREGFLWDIPIFGIFTPVIESIAPGFGKSKISSGAGTFRVEGGRVHTDDMEVRAQAFRLKYDGSVDFEGNLDARVEAQMFRDAWIFGRAVSAAFWPLAKAFESKVTGNLSAPKSEFAHIPKIMLFPLRPIQTLKEMFPKDKAAQPQPSDNK